MNLYDMITSKVEMMKVIVEIKTMTKENTAYTFISMEKSFVLNLRSRENGVKFRFYMTLYKFGGHGRL